MKAQIRIGVDTGGTFTDFTIISKGKISTKKIPSTPDNPSQAIIQGISEFLETNQPPLQIIHGTTVATNALLERKGGKIALITTKGFEDLLLIGRQVRRHLYRLKGQSPSPLLSRQQCFGISERIASNGAIESKISLPELERLIKQINQKKFQAVAVSLINSYANPHHEKIIHKELKKAKLLASISSDILPEHREFERTALTAVNAYLMPVISRYLKNLEAELGKAKLYIMQSNEGYISPATAKAEPIRTALSGPAGGVVAAFHIAKAAGYKNIISFDMGGTSSDVSLLDNRIRRTNEIKIGEYPIRLPIIDIHTVGAGGGSLAHYDRGGSLRVGPQSAGADPGPACYGHSHIPTVTDANVVLGRLSPDFFLGGNMTIFPERSWQALETISAKIGKTVLETAEGIIAIANANMEKAIRVISIERGIDPRSFALFSFGGAGGLHAAEMAAHLNIGRVIIPSHAGVLSALGLLLADSIKDYSRSLLKVSDKVKPDTIDKLFQALIQKGLREMQQEGFQDKDIRFMRYLDLRYLGQSYEITIPMRKQSSIISDFHKAHQKLYSYHHTQQPVEIVNIRVKAIGLGRKIKLRILPESHRSPDAAFFKWQDVYIHKRKHLSPIYIRARLQPGNIIKGPALIADTESTTFLPPAHKIQVDGYLNLIMERSV